MLPYWYLIVIGFYIEQISFFFVIITFYGNVDAIKYYAPT